MKWEKICNNFFIIKLPPKKNDILIQTLPFKVVEISASSKKNDILKIINKMKLNAKNYESFRGYFAIDLVITTRCNLRCKYCYALSEKKEGFYGLEPEDMSINTASKIIDISLHYFEREIKKAKTDKLKFDLFISGGEPLLNLKCVKYILKEFTEKINLLSKKYNAHVDFSSEIATNGTKIDDKISKLFKKYNTQVVITLDGKLHDKKRMYVDGSGSLNDVLNALKILIRNNNKIKLQSIIPINKIDEQNTVLEFYKKHGLLDKIKRVHLIPQASPIFDRYLEKDKKTIKEKNKEFYKMYGESLFKMGKEFDLDIKNYQGRMFRSIEIGGLDHRCPAALWKLSFVPSGDIYPCHQLTNIKEFHMGNVNDGIDRIKIDSSKIKSVFRKRFVWNVTPCKDCVFQTICIPFVDCPARCFLETGNLNTVPDYYCEIHKPYMEKLLEKFILKK